MNPGWRGRQRSQQSGDHERDRTRALRLNTYGDLESVPLVTRREYRDGILATIAREDEIARFRDERTCHCHQAGYRFNVLISRAVDHIDRVIAGMCDVEPVRGVMNISVIESATGSMLREFDVAEQTKCHRC